MKNVLLVCLLCFMLCAGCAQQEDGIEVTDTPVVETPLVTEPALSPEPVSSPEPTPVEKVETPGITSYTLDSAVTVDGRALTLRLHGQVDSTDGFERIGIRAVDVLESAALLQTLSVQDAFAAMYAQEGLVGIPAEPWTQCWTKDGSLTTEDLNFDGYPDLRLMGTAGTVNITYLCWLWNPDCGLFEYAFSLVGHDVRVDSVAQQLITRYRDGYGQYYTDYSRYDAVTRSLLLMKQIMDDQLNQTTTIHERIDGEWVQTG